MPNIPNKIHLIYKTHTIPSKYEEYVEIIKTLHSDWEITIYSDSDARIIIVDHFPNLLKLYDKYELDIQRTDLFRIVIIYLFGGFYLDLDMLCFKRLDSLCDYNLVLGEEKTLSDEECFILGHKHPLRIANYMFGSVPKHAFWLEVINGLVQNANTKIVSEDDVLSSTGPDLLTNIYHSKKNIFSDLELLYNSNLKCIKSCGTISCHFGDYAAHFHLGNWRWENKL